MNFHKLTERLEPGAWFWRWRSENGTWSAPIGFEMPDDAEDCVTPSFDEILANTRKDIRG